MGQGVTERVARRGARKRGRGAAARGGPFVHSGAWAVLGGAFVFAMDLNLLAMGAPKWVAALAPAGGTAMMLTVLGIAVLKVQMVANYFMELRHTRWLWRGIVLGWLVSVTGLIAIAYLTTIK